MIVKRITWAIDMLSRSIRPRRSNDAPVPKRRPCCRQCLRGCGHRDHSKRRCPDWIEAAAGTPAAAPVVARRPAQNVRKSAQNVEEECAVVSAAEIARALNGRHEGRRWRCQCPACGRGNLTVGDMRGGRHLVKCWNGCDYKEIFIALFAQGLLQGDDEDHLRDERRRSNDEAEERRQREEIEQLRRGICRARVLYRSTVPGAGTIVEIYWQSRGLAGPLPPVLRFAQYYKHRNPEYGYLPAMVAPVVNVYGQQTGVAATFLRPDGRARRICRNEIS